VSLWLRNCAATGSAMEPKALSARSKAMLAAVNWRASQAGGAFEASDVAGPVVPGVVGRTLFHGGEYVDQAWVLPTLGEDLLDPRLLTEIAVAADELDLQAGLGRQPFGVLAQFLTQRLGSVGVVDGCPVRQAIVPWRRHVRCRAACQ
jgi:hypothetical protein